MTPSLAEIAAALGGEVAAGQVLAPGPGHSPRDRSLSVKPDKDAPAGFVVHSFAGDDSLLCRDHVRKLLGLTAFERKKNESGGRKSWTLISEHIYRTEANEPFLRVRKCLDEHGKKQYPKAVGTDANGPQVSPPAGRCRTGCQS